MYVCTCLDLCLEPLDDLLLPLLPLLALPLLLPLLYSFSYSNISPDQ